MQVRNYLGLAVLPLFFAFCPSLSAVSYTWNFAGSGGTNCLSGNKSCTGQGNSMAFTSSGVTATVSAWYVNGNGTLMSATLGQYSSGLGACTSLVKCSGSAQELDDNGNDDFLLFQFSKPIDPTSITLNSPTNGGLGVSYWLGSTTNQSLSLTNMGMTTSLSTLGFGSQQNVAGGTGIGTVNFGGAPMTSVNAILFGAMYGSNVNSFDVYSLSGMSVSGVPEPTSIILLFTVAVAVWGLRRRAQQLPQ